MPKPMSITYNGRQYASFAALCREMNLDYRKAYPRYKKGESIREITDAAINELIGDITAPDPPGVYGTLKNQSGIYVISRMSKAVRDIFEANPYCVLGIPCNSPRSAALDTLAKLEKMQRLNAVSAYKSEYDLTGIEPPDRDPKSVRAALNNLDSTEHRWFWFLSARFSDKWQDAALFDTSRQIIISEDIAGITGIRVCCYDEFLACYLNALITDPYFYAPKKWLLMAHMLDMLYNMDSSRLYAVLSPRLTEAERKKYNYRMTVGDFKDNLYNPLLAHIRQCEGMTLYNAVTLFKHITGQTKITAKPVINEAIARWADKALSGITDLMNRIKTKRVLSESTYSDASDMLAQLRLAEGDFETAKRIAAELDDLQSTLLMGKFAQVIYDATYVMQYGGRHFDSYKYDAMILPYCNDYQKSEIQRVTPASFLDTARA